MSRWDYEGRGSDYMVPLDLGQRMEKIKLKRERAEQPYKCPNCPTVPVVSVRLAEQLFEEMPPAERQKALVLAMEWLCQKHEGLALYNGVNGREYTNEEKKAISYEASTVAGLPCPFWRASRCSLRGLGPHYNRTEEAQSEPYGWLPVLVARVLDRPQLILLASEGAIADAKIALLTRNDAI